MRLPSPSRAQTDVLPRSRRGVRFRLSVNTTVSPFTSGSSPNFVGSVMVAPLVGVGRPHSSV